MDTPTGSAAFDPTLSAAARTEVVNLPSWDELLMGSLKLSDDPTFIDQALSLRSKPRKNLLRFGKMIAFMTQKDPTYRKFVGSSWEEIVDIITTQIAENARIRCEFAKSREELEPVSSQAPDDYKRRFQQQPCTRHTATRRVEYARKFLNPKSSILLLGDDDFVAIELARSGFENLTVVDIDAGIISQISSICAREGHDIKLFQHDLRDAPPDSLQNRDYNLVFLDPSYSLQGIETFIEAARAITTRSSSPYYFLSIHLMSLMKKGLAEFSGLLDSMDLRVIDFQKSFNLYPIPSKTRNLISLVNNTIASAKVMRSEGAFRYFTSDALLLQPSPVNGPTLAPRKKE